MTSIPGDPVDSERAKVVQTTRGFDSGIIRQTILQAAVDQKSIKAVTDTTRGTYSDDYTLAQLHTVPADDLEAVVNDLLVQQAEMILGPEWSAQCLSFQRA